METSQDRHITGKRGSYGPARCRDLQFPAQMKHASGRKPDEIRSSRRRRRRRGGRRVRRARDGVAQSRDQIRIVGSSTVFPYTQAVAEQFAGMTGNPAPVVESTGTGGGMQIFCGGVGPDHPDITGASRAMKESEFELCAANGVDSVTEVLIGYDGLSIAHSRRRPRPRPDQGADLPGARRRGRRSTARSSPTPTRTGPRSTRRCPTQPIQVFGPPPTSGTRDAFVELVMLEGCGELRGDRRRSTRTARRRSARACARTARSSRPARTTT